MSRKRIGALIATGLAVATIIVLTWIFLAQRGEKATVLGPQSHASGHEGDLAQDTGVEGARSTKVPSAAEGKESRVAAPTALPPSDIPLASSYAALLHAAESGNVGAACRLAIELIGCSERGEGVSSDLEQLAAQDETYEEPVIGVLTRTAQSEDQRSMHCAGAPSDPAAPEELLRAASEAGFPRAKVLYALLSERDGIARLALPSRLEAVSAPSIASQYYADHALAFLEHGLRQFDPLALEGLILIHAPRELHRPHVPRIRSPNPLLFARYAMLLDSIQPGSLPRDVELLLDETVSALGPERALQVERQVRAQSATWMRKAPKASLRVPLDLYSNVSDVCGT